MNKKEIKAYAQRCLAGQGNQVDLGSGLADVIVTLADLLPDPADIDVKTYLTFKTADEKTNSVRIRPSDEFVPPLVLYYSRNAKDWFPWEDYTKDMEFSASKPLYLCGMNDRMSDAGEYNQFVFTNNEGVYCEGSIMSLLDYTVERESIDADFAFSYLFSGCTSLVQAPELPAMVLVDNCYENMFSYCTSLVQAPELPATELAVDCYLDMFKECAALNYVKCLATISILGGTSTWLTNVSATGTFVKAQDAEWPSGASGIPTGWTVEEV